MYQLAAHLLLHKIHNLATLGFPVPDTDHQKHVSSFEKTLVVARLYIAMWMQSVVSRCGQEAPEVKPPSSETSARAEKGPQQDGTTMPRSLKSMVKRNAVK